MKVAFKDEPESDHAPEVLKALSERVSAQNKLVRPNGQKGRPQHEKGILSAFGVVRIEEDISELAKQGPFAVAGNYLAAIRFSNGQPIELNDHFPDVRGIAVKFFPPEAGETDLLATNERGRSHARTAKDFVDVADVLANLDKAFEGHPAGLETAAVDIVRDNPGLKEVKEGLRVAGILVRATALPVKSLALETYWGSVVKLGDTPVKYSLRPDAQSADSGGRSSGRDYLRADLEQRLSNRQTIRFELCVHFFVDDTSTPVADASIVWPSEPVRVGVVEIDKLPTKEEEDIINSMAFNPGHGFEPLGITHAREKVYEESAKNRDAMSADKVREHFQARARATSA